MKADLTRDTFAPRRHYSRVIQQQGRVPIDADWNEQAQIQDHHDRTEAIDVIGAAGFPQGTAFQLTASADKTDLLIGDGNGYVGGILAENTHTAADVLGFPSATKLQLRTLVLDGVALRPGEWLLIDDTTVAGYTPAQLRIAAVDPATRTVTLTAAATSSPSAFVKRVTSYLIQPDWYAPDLVTFKPPALPALTGSGSFLAYLDVWRRHVTALEDPHLREVALGGPDTCTRAKTVWQVKLAAIAAGQTADCSTPLPVEKSTGRLGARARQPATGDTPCVITPTGRYRSLENQLYRVEIHDPGPLDTATFKFSRDNGMVMVSWLASSGADLSVSSLGRDKVLGFAQGQWIELIDDSVDESPGPGTLAKIKTVDPATSTITIDTATVSPAPSPTTRGFDIKNYPLSPRIRRWDHVATKPALSVTRPAGDGYLDLEQGVQIRFEDGHYASGDYWLIPARTITADVEWPRNETGDPLPQARAGIKHHVARLGIVTISGGAITGVTDCRPQFPPLTQLPPSGSSCCCGVMIRPGDDPQAVIDAAIAKAGTGKIDGLTVEFAAGTFQLKLPIRIAAPQPITGHLVVKGCGPSTRLIAAGHENVLRIVGWESATVTDLYAEAGITATGAGAKGRPDQEPPPPSPNPDVNRHLLGVVYIRNCITTRAERLELTCASGPRREASCLMVWNDFFGRAFRTDDLIEGRALDERFAGIHLIGVNAASAALAGESWVKDCKLHVGHMQVGVLLVNQRRATVADNVIASYTPSQDAIVKITTSPRYLPIYRRLIATDATIAWRGTIFETVEGFTNHSFMLGGLRVLFRADAMLGAAWQNVLTTSVPPGATADDPAQPEGPQRPLDLQLLKVRRKLYKMASGVLDAAVNPGAKTKLTPQQLKPFKDWIAIRQLEFLPTASAGIVVAGELGGDLRVTDNTVEGAMDGIHLGFSHHEASNNRPDVAQRVQVVGNTVAVAIAPEITRGIRRAIFVGNGTSITVKRNRVTVPFPGRAQASVEGVSVWGKEGPFVVVAENDVTGATIGIRMTLTAIEPVDKPQWLASNNATFGCIKALELTDPVMKSGNVP